MISPFVYGETVHSSISDFLLLLKRDFGLFQTPVLDSQGKKARHCFYDLGSGLGKPCVTAALTLPDYLTECTGIELLEGLLGKSKELAVAYDQSEWAQGRRAQNKNCPELSYIKDDFIVNNEDWVSNANVVFANATCFEPDMLETIAMLLRVRFTPG